MADDMTPPAEEWSLDFNPRQPGGVPLDVFLTMSKAAATAADRAGYVAYFKEDTGLGVMWLKLKPPPPPPPPPSAPSAVSVEPGAYLMSTTEAARRLARHPVTLRNDLREGRLPGILRGRRWFMSSTDVDRITLGGTF